MNRNPTTPTALIGPGSPFVAATMLLNDCLNTSNIGVTASSMKPDPTKAVSADLTMPSPIFAAACSMLPKFSASASSVVLTMALSMSNGPASITSPLNVNILSLTIDTRPSNVSANASAASPNLPPGPNTLLSASAVSSAVTVTPALNPNISLTPLSLKSSADEIPALNDLCICSPAVTKSSPATAATLPVSSKFSLSCSASSDTTANTPAACAISSSENGTCPAKSLSSSKALAPSSAVPNRNPNLVSSVSSCLAVARNDPANLVPPMAANAPVAIFAAVPSPPREEVMAMVLAFNCLS